MSTGSALTRARLIERRGVVARIVDDIKSADPRVAKGGIQAACEYLEAKRRLPATQEKFARALSYQLRSDDEFVRRWAYKLIAILRSERHRPFLETQLRSKDHVPENRTWAVAALASADRDYLRTLYNVGDQRTLAYDLAATMFASPADAKAVVRRAIETDDPLVHQWLGLLYGDARINLPKSVLHDLTASEYPAVVEYAIWGIRKRRTYGTDIVAIDPVALESQPVNVRRWYYRLVAQDPVARNAFEAQVISWIETEPDSKALEGLARGLHESPRDRQWRDIYQQWRKMEHDPFVMRALGCRVTAAQLAAVPIGRNGTAKDRLLRLDSSLPLFGSDAPLIVGQRTAGADAGASPDGVVVSVATLGQVAEQIIEQGPVQAIVRTDADAPDLSAFTVQPTSPVSPMRVNPIQLIHIEEFHVTNNPQTVMNFNHSTVGAAQGSGTQINSGVHQSVTHNAAELLTTLAEHLVDHPTARAEAEALAAEAREAGGTPEPTNKGFWGRVRALTSGLGEGGAAIAAGTGVVQNLDQLAQAVQGLPMP